VDFFGPLFGDFAQEFQRQMGRLGCHPSRGSRYGPQFTLNFGETFANIFRKFDTKK
jgi:hypothetical protein